MTYSYCASTLCRWRCHVIHWNLWRNVDPCFCSKRLLRLEIWTYLISDFFKLFGPTTLTTI